MLSAVFSTFSYIESCSVCDFDADDEVVFLAVLDELPLVLDVLLLSTLPERLLLALLRFLDLKSEFLELFIFILYSYPFYILLLFILLLFLQGYDSSMIHDFVYVIYIGNTV